MVVFMSVIIITKGFKSFPTINQQTENYCNNNFILQEVTSYTVNTIVFCDFVP